MSKDLPCVSPSSCDYNSYGRNWTATLCNDQTELKAGLKAWERSTFMERRFPSLARARQASTELESRCTGHRYMASKQENPGGRWVFPQTTVYSTDLMTAASG